MPCQPSERPGQSLVGLRYLFKSGVPLVSGVRDAPRHGIRDSPCAPNSIPNSTLNKVDISKPGANSQRIPIYSVDNSTPDSCLGIMGHSDVDMNLTHTTPKPMGHPDSDAPTASSGYLDLIRGMPKDPVDLDPTTLSKPRKGSRSIACGRSGHPTKTNRVERASGRQAPKVHSELRTYHLTPLDSEHSPGVQDRVSAVSPKSTLQSSALLSSRKPMHLGGIESPAITGSNSPNTSGAMGRLFPLQPLLGPKERWGMRPVINLKNLNAFVVQEHFKMEGLHLLSSLV